MNRAQADLCVALLKAHGYEAVVELNGPDTSKDYTVIVIAIAPRS